MNRRRATSVRLTSFGLLVLSVLLLSGFFSPIVADPQVTGVAWTALAAIFSIGVLWPPIAVSIARVTVLAAPTDGTVGIPFDLRIELGGLPGLVELRVLGAMQGWRSAHVPDVVTVQVAASTRGRLERLAVDVQSSGPLGILRVRRRMWVELDRPLWIGPAPTPEPWVPGSTTNPETSAPVAVAAASGDVVRSTRPYRPGDPAHLVHWPSTARTGALVVRELEPPVGVGVCIVVAMRGGAEDEMIASRAAGLVRAALAHGSRVMLCTHGPDGAQAVAVPSPVVAGRLLAEAMPGPPGVAPRGWSVVRLES